MTQPVLSLPPEPVELCIESLGGLGDGIGHYDGKPVFVPKACVGDKLSVRLLRQNHDGLHGLIERVITPGPARVEAPCPHFSTCGSCAMQQLGATEYHAFKTRLLQTALQNAGFALIDAPMIFIPPGERRRVEFAVTPTQDGIALAFHELRSYRLVTVDNCLVLEPALQALMQPLNAALSALPFRDKLKAVNLTAADSGIDVLLTLNGPADFSALENVCDKIGAARMAVRFPDERMKIVCERAPVEMQLGPFAVPLPADAFLQATRLGQQMLTDFAIRAAASANSTLDLFCGIGSYSFPLAATKRVHAVEGDAAMVEAMRRAIQKHSLSTLTAEPRDLFKKPLTTAELSRFDTVIINPPRPGARAQSEQIAQSTINIVAMISCNPATFSRDARILKGAGFRLQEATGIDQFVWSPYLEIAALFVR